jgi:hypothetical protein
MIDTLNARPVNSAVRQLSICTSRTNHGKANDFEIRFYRRPWSARLYFWSHIARHCRTTIRPYDAWNGRLCFCHQQALFRWCTRGVSNCSRGGVVFHCSRSPAAAFELNRYRTQLRVTSQEKGCDESE